MDGSILLWNDDNGYSILVKETGRKLCCLEFHLEDLDVTICSSKGSFLNACLGARFHFASEEGSCEFDHQGDTMRIVVQQWRGPKASVEVSPLEFERAIRELSIEKPDPKDVKLF